MSINSLRFKIFLNSSIILLLSITMILIGYIHFNDSKKFSSRIIPLSYGMSELFSFHTHIQDLSNNLDEYFVTRSELSAELIQDELSDLDNILNQFWRYDIDQNAIDSIIGFLQFLKERYNYLYIARSLSSREKNEVIIEIYESIDQISSIHNELLKHSSQIHS